MSPSSEFRNLLLRQLAPDELIKLQAHLEHVPIKIRQKLVISNAPVDHVYFPESGLVSVIAEPRHEHPIEVGHIGREGVTVNVPPDGPATTPLLHLVQISGFAWRIPSPQFAVALSNMPGLTSLLMRYHQSFIVQVSYTALSHGRETVETRLARWLLMCHDRMDGNELPLVHDFLAMMLGVRRPSVTLAMHQLIDKGLIRNARGRITIVERAKLEALAGPSYGTPESHYRQLLGEDIRAGRREISTEDDSGDSLEATE